MTTIGNAPDGSDDVTERVIEPGATAAHTRSLGFSYPPQIFSLSHVAIPFPPDDALYGTQPPNTANAPYGNSLGAFVPRGERGALMVSLDSMFRISSNPFFPYLLARIDDAIVNVPRSGIAPSSISRQLHPVPSVPSWEPDPDFDDMQRRVLDIGHDGETIP